MVAWSVPYRTMPELQSVNAQERVEEDAMQIPRTGPKTASPAETAAVLSAVGKLRNYNREMARLSPSNSPGWT
jgi:hypothetical protein